VVPDLSPLLLDRVGGLLDGLPALEPELLLPKQDDSLDIVEERAGLVENGIVVVFVRDDSDLLLAVDIERADLLEHLAVGTEPDGRIDVLEGVGEGALHVDLVVFLFMFSFEGHLEGVA